MIACIWGAKGGTAKTSSAINLAAALANPRRRVLLIDFDPQATATKGLGLEPANGFLGVLLGEARAADRVQPVQGLTGLDLLPGSPDLAGAERRLANETGAERLLAVALAPLVRRYSVVLIDTGPGVNVLSVAALAAADLHLAPIMPQPYAVGSLPDTLAVAGRVRERLNRRLGQTRIALCAVTRSRVVRDTVEGLRQRFGRQVTRAEIPSSAIMLTAAARRVPVVTLRPDSPASLAYRALARELFAARSLR